MEKVLFALYDCRRVAALTGYSSKVRYKTNRRVKIDYRKLSFFIIGFGMILVLVGTIMYLNNLPLKVDGGQSESFSLKTF
jgi:hypothetical protein